MNEQPDDAEAIEYRSAEKSRTARSLEYVAALLATSGLIAAFVLITLNLLSHRFGIWLSLPSSVGEALLFLWILSAPSGLVCGIIAYWRRRIDPLGLIILLICFFDIASLGAGMAWFALQAQGMMH